MNILKAKIVWFPDKLSFITEDSLENKIDWDKQPELVSIIGKESKHLEKGKEYKVNREMAKILVGKGVATLK